MPPTFVTLFREATGPHLRPVRVQVRHSPLGGRAALEALFGVAPVFEADVAGGLGMGARTLQRRLSDRALTFQAQVDEARRRLVQEPVSGSRCSLAEIAFLTGF